MRHREKQRGGCQTPGGEHESASWRFLRGSGGASAAAKRARQTDLRSAPEGVFQAKFACFLSGPLLECRRAVAPARAAKPATGHGAGTQVGSRTGGWGSCCPIFGEIEDRPRFPRARAVTPKKTHCAIREAARCHAFLVHQPEVPDTYDDDLENLTEWLDLASFILCTPDDQLPRSERGQRDLAGLVSPEGDDGMPA